MKAIVKITLNSGMILRSDIKAVSIKPNGDLFCPAWDMRFSLSRNTHHTRIVSPGEVKKFERVHF